MWKVLKLKNEKMKIQDAISLAIDNTLKEGLTDVEVFSPPFELTMVKGALLDKIKQSIKESLNHTSIKLMKVSPIGHVLFPKKELFDFRKCAHTHPLDEMKYLSLVIQIAGGIEKMRIGKSKKIVFSYRFSPQKGYLFDSEYNYTSFREHVSKKSKSKKINVVVSCDISNFYDRLNLHRLENILESCPGIDKKIVVQINELLLFWSNRDSYGLPVGSNASRILAEASLIEVDNYLLSKKIDFCRFVDDYRIFAKDSATAHYWLSLLVGRLSQEGFFINTSKTEIKDVSQFFEEDGVHSISESVAVAVVLESDASSVVVDAGEAVDDGVLNRKFNIPRIIRGYSGLIPTKFRKLTDGEVDKLKSVDARKLLAEVQESIVIEPKKFVHLTKACVAQKLHHVLVELVMLLDKFPQFLPYILDIVKKSEESFSDESVLKVSDTLNQWLVEAQAPEFILVYIVRFFGSGRFSNKTILFEYFRSLKRNEGSYIGRAVLEQLEPLVNRGEVIEIRDYYSRADLWEKRQIAKMVDIHISDGEKRPFFKNILSLEDDVFLNGIQGSFCKAS